MKAIAALQRGFTLIEVIIIITMGALIAAMVAPFIGTAVTRSSEPVNLVVEGGEINQVMADILADYRNEAGKDDFNLATFKSGLSDFEKNGVTVTGTFIVFEKESGDYQDFNGDGVYDPTEKGDTVTDLLRITASKNLQALSVILGDQR